MDQMLVLALVAAACLAGVLYYFVPLAVAAGRSWNAYRKGLAAYKAGDLAAAERLWRRAIDLSRVNASARLALGMLLAGRGEADAALEQYRQALAIRPGYAKAHMNLANLLLRQGQVHEALESYQRAAPRIVRAHKMIGHIYQYHLADRRRALESYTRYLYRVGRDPEVEAWIRELTGQGR